MRSDDQKDAVSVEARYTTEQIRAALDALSTDDYAQLKLLVRHFAPRSGMSEEELLQEAFLRVLATRTCKVGVGIVAFMAGTIKSIASEAPRARKKAKENLGLELVYVPEYGDADGQDPEDEESMSPEDEALAGVMYGREVARVATLLDGDDELQLLVEGLVEGQRGKELEELLATDTKGLAAAKKRLLRKMKLGFPNGVPL